MFVRRFSPLLLLGLLLITSVCYACQPLNGSPTEALSAVRGSPTSTITSIPKTKIPRQITPTQTSPPSLSPTPTFAPLNSCLQVYGAVEISQLPSQKLGGPFQFRVYVPPCFDPSAKPGYPTIYLLHGQGYTDNQWDRLGVEKVADQLVSSKQLPPFLIVMPYDAGIGQPSQDAFGDALVDELIPWIETYYAARPGREYRAIGGLSRGAAWAIHIGLLHPDLFSTVGAHSLPIFWEDAPHIKQWLSEISPENMPRIYLDIGRSDPQVEEVTEFEALLTQMQVPHEWHLNLGYHEESYWSAHLKQYLQWYCQTWSPDRVISPS